MFVLGVLLQQQQQQHTHTHERKRAHAQEVEEGEEGSIVSSTSYSSFFKKEQVSLLC